MDYLEHWCPRDTFWETDLGSKERSRNREEEATLANTWVGLGSDGCVVPIAGTLAVGRGV